MNASPQIGSLGEGVQSRTWPHLKGKMESYGSRAGSAIQYHLVLHFEEAENKFL